MFKGKIDLDGKLVETNMVFHDIDAFENYLESLNEHHDEKFGMRTETVVFIRTDIKFLISLKEVILVRDLKVSIKKQLNT